ncbi:MAG: anthranilate synthase component I [Lachnospiraceae bacterium]|nr:anthranilate synthase component I [Lachnospiraceae bacterium]MDD3615937.1 anthranilate synthase component I [Lachnospiraceae bacterium]
MYRPTLEEAKELIKEGSYKVVPISCELYEDVRTPIQVLKILKSVSKHCYMLESVEDNSNHGRYTFLGFDPVLGMACTNGKMVVESGTKMEFETKHPGEFIKNLIRENKSPKLPFLPTFTGGLVGYFAYDYIKYAEPVLKLDAKDEEEFKDVDLMLFDKVIAFDHFRGKIILIANAKVDNLETEYNKAVMELEKIANLIRNGLPKKEEKPELLSELTPLFKESEYCEMVEKAKKYIYDGDIFQVVLSNRLEAKFKGSLLDVYRVLRTTNPSPYMFYFSSDDVEIAGASPETLVKVIDGNVRTYPLAGTRPRGKSEREDKELEMELLADEKELAEHNMLVDLGRNDIGKISKFRSVHVDKYMQIERFSHVMHIGSEVEGNLREDKDAVDAVDAVLPAGTLSGAPKIRACQIINELENNKRGIYGGAIGYIDFTGNMDTCIGIRLAFSKNGKIFVRSGAGIVADSVPKKEHQECLNKARAVIDAIEIAREGIDQ